MDEQRKLRNLLAYTKTDSVEGLEEVNRLYEKLLAYINKSQKEHELLGLKNKMINAYQAYLASVDTHDSVYADKWKNEIFKLQNEVYTLENFKKEEFILPNAKVTKFLVSNDLNTEVFDNLQEAVEYFNPMIAPCYLMFECGGKIFIIEEK
jgi:hypothetical protein